MAEVQTELFVQEVFTIACGRWEERMLAGLVFVDRAVVGGARIAIDPKLERARKEEQPFSHVFGLRTDKGGSFDALELRGWFPSADNVLV